MTAAWYIIFMPPLIVIAGLFWGCVALLGFSAIEEIRYRKKLRAHRGRA